MLFERIGVEWARLLTYEDRNASASDGRDVERVLVASPEQFAAIAGKLAIAIYSSEGPLLERARAVILSGGPQAAWAEVERIGRALIIVSHLSEQGGAAGHFLAGQALWFRRNGRESSRHFRLACRAYQSLGSPVLGALSGVAAAAAPADCRDSGFPERIQEAFGELAAVDAECAQRLVPAMDHDLEVYRVVREVIAGGAVPTALPEPVTEDDLHLVRSAKVDSLDQPERAVAIARWIQSLRGLREDETEELDILVLLLERVRKWDALVFVLRDMIAHGEQRFAMVTALARALVETGQWSEAKALLTTRVDGSTGPERVKLLQQLVILGTLAGDPDSGRWMAELRAMGGELPEGALPPPTMVAEAAEIPELLARFDNGTLTIDPRIASKGQDAVTAHIRAAIVLGAGPEKGRELLDDIAAKDPDLYLAVVGLLPRYARPPSEAEKAMARAERLFGHREYRSAIVAYQEAIRLDPEFHLAHLALGDAYYMLGEYLVAIAHFTESIAIQPTAQAHRFLGDAIQNSGGDLRQAERCYEDALAVDPAYGGARSALDDVRRKLTANNHHGDGGYGE